jgi:hypothetical protein
VDVVAVVLILGSIGLNIESLRLRRTAARSLELERPQLTRRASLYVALATSLMLTGAVVGWRR